MSGLNRALQDYAQNRWGSRWLDVTFHLPERGSVQVSARRQTGSGVKHFSALICPRCGADHLGFNHACAGEQRR